MQESQEYEIDLFELVIILLKKWFIIAAAFIIILGAAGIYSYVFLEDSYQASTTMLVLVEEDPNNPNQVISINGLGDQYDAFAKSNAVLEYVQENLTQELSLSQIASMIQISSVSNTVVLNLTVESTDATLSRDVANLATEGIFENTTNFSSYEDVEILSLANVPSAPSGPNRTLYLAIGGVLGLMIGVFGVFILEFMDPSIKSSKDIDHKLQLRTLGVIPTYNSKKEGGLL